MTGFGGVGSGCGDCRCGRQGRSVGGCGLTGWSNRDIGGGGRARDGVTFVMWVIVRSEEGFEVWVEMASSDGICGRISGDVAVGAP